MMTSKNSDFATNLSVVGSPLVVTDVLPLGAQVNSQGRGMPGLHPAFVVISVVTTLTGAGSPTIIAQVQSSNDPAFGSGIFTHWQTGDGLGGGVPISGWSAGRVMLSIPLQPNQIYGAYLRCSFAFLAGTLSTGVLNVTLSDAPPFDHFSPDTTN